MRWLWLCGLCACQTEMDEEPPAPTPMTTPVEEPANGLPEVLDIEMTFGFATDGEDPHCSATTDDPNGDDVVIRWSWWIDDTLTSIDTASFPRSELIGDTTLSCEATPFDGRDEGASMRASTPVKGPGGNILVILVDDLGMDYFGAYNDQPDGAQTPRMDALADEGLLFRRAYTQSVCSATRASLLTGRYPSRHGVGSWLTLSRETWELPDAEVTIPEMLRYSRAHDYTSVALGKWHLTTKINPRPELHPLQQGFSHYAGALGNPTMTIESTGPDRGYYHWEKWTNGMRSVEQTYMTTDLVDDALELLPTVQEPWFGWVSFNAPHSPWHVPPDELNPRGISRPAEDTEMHRAMVEALDIEIGRLLDGLDLSDTTLVLMSDNGTVSDVIVAPYNTRRGKGTVFEGGIRVPMIVTGPLVENGGRETEALVHAVDLLPTVAEIAGVDLADVPSIDDEGNPRALHIDGRSALSLLRSPDEPWSREVLYAEKLANNGGPPWRQRELVAVDATHKLVWRDRIQDQFYDLSASSLDEGLNLEGSLDADQEAIKAQLWTGLQAWDADLTFDWPSLVPEPTGPTPGGGLP